MAGRCRRRLVLGNREPGSWEGGCRSQTNRPPSQAKPNYACTPPGGVGEIRARPEAILATPSCVSSAEKRPDQGLGESSAMGG